jgi:hypothetical protein
MMTLSARSRNRNRLHRFFGWDSPKAVARVHLVFEWLETLSLAAAIGLEILEVRVLANICWVILAGSDACRHVYGLRDKRLTGDEQIRLQAELETLKGSGKNISTLLSKRGAGRPEDFTRAMAAYPCMGVVIADDASDPGLAARIANGLEDAGWKIIALETRSGLTEGVYVSLPREQWANGEPCAKAGMALLAWLNNNNTAAIKWTHLREDSGGPDVLHIAVGPPPKTLQMLKLLGDTWELQKNDAEGLRDLPT